MNPHHNHVIYSFIPSIPTFRASQKKEKQQHVFVLAVHFFFKVFFNFFFEELSLPSVLFHLLVMIRVKQAKHYVIFMVPCQVFATAISDTNPQNKKSTNGNPEKTGGVSSWGSGL